MTNDSEIHSLAKVSCREPEPEPQQEPEQHCPYCHDTAWKEVICGAGTTRTVCQSCDHPANDCYCGCEQEPEQEQDLLEIARLLIREANSISPAADFPDWVWREVGMNGYAARLLMAASNLSRR